MNAALIDEFNKGRAVTINADKLGIWDLTTGDIKVKIRDSRIFKREKNSSAVYWIGRLVGKRDLRRKRLQPLEASEI